MTNEPIPTAEAILKALVEAGVPQRVIAQKLAIPQSAVSNLFNGKRVLKLHEANTLLALLPRREVKRVPVIGMAGAGNWLEAIEHALDTIQLPDSGSIDGTFAVEVSGNSMNLMLPEGSIAIIDPEDRRLFAGKIYLLRNADGEATIKRYRVEPSRFEPASDDPSYQPFEVGSSDFQVVGRVTGSYTKF